MKYITSIIVCLFVQVLSIAQYNQYGARFIHNYDTELAGVSTSQCWSVTQDFRGVIYLSSMDGLYEYDGFTWNKVNDHGSPMSVAVDPSDGVVYVAYSDDFGYLSPDEKGQQVFHSLKSLIDDIVFLDDEIRFRNDSVFFMGRANAVAYDKKRNTASKWNPNYKAREIIFGNNNITSSADSLILIKRDTAVYAGVRFAQPVRLLLDAEQINSRDILFTCDTHLEAYDKTSHKMREVRLGVFSDDIRSSGQFDKLISLPDNQFAVSTRGAIDLAGICVFDSLYNVTEMYGTHTGLGENFATSMYYSESDGHLWGTNWTLSRVNMRSPIRKLNDVSAIGSRVTAIGVCDGNVYCSSTAGIFHRVREENGFYTFKRMPNTEHCGVSYDMSKYYNPHTGKNGLMILTDVGIYLVEDGKAYLAEGVPYNSTFQNPEDNSVVCLWYNTINKYTITPSHKLKNVQSIELPADVDINTCYYKDGYYWILCYTKDVYRVDPKTLETVVCFRPKGSSLILNMPEPSVFDPATKTILQWNKLDDTFSIPNENIKMPDINYENIQMYVYGNGFFVCGPNEKGFIIPSEADPTQYEYIKLPYSELCDKIITDVWTDVQNSTIYFFSTNNVYVYQTDLQFRKLREDAKISYYDYNALVRKVSTKDSTIFYGAFYDDNGHLSLTQNAKQIPTIAYEDANLTFIYSAACYDQEPNMEFSFILEGNGEKWSEWGRGHITNFTNLHEGEYTFRVKARNALGVESSISSYTFIITPPFYRSIWAYLVYLIIAAFVIYESMILYSKKLKRENEQLERMVDERTADVRQKDHEIMSNINYASYIQMAALTPRNKILQIFPEHFIMYRPHSIVSGDFYIVASFGTKKLCIVADCTGHGVSGGFLSMLGISFFRQVIANTQDPAEILSEMRDHIIANLNQSDELVNNQDGMDATVFVVDSETNLLEFAGANSRLVIVHNGELTELQGDKVPVSTHFAHLKDSYTNNTFQLSKGDMVYAFTDGYTDQFGGVDISKFKLSRFRSMLHSMADKSMVEQNDIINKTFDDYRGTTPQTDDVLVLGVRI